MTKKQKELEGKIIEANQKYREGAPIMSDKEYDLLIDQLKKEYPDSEILAKPIIEENKRVIGWKDYRILCSLWKR